MPLILPITVTVSRRKRARCPECGQRRVLFALDAYSTDQPVGYGIALCRACAGLREPTK